MSTHLPGAPGAGGLPADLEAAGLRPDEPGLTELLTALTAPPTSRELSGEQAALTMFRANLGAPAAVLAEDNGPNESTQILRRAPRQGRSTGWRLRIGFAAAAALTAAGTVSAAYAAMLPPAVQHLAHQVLGFAGVPDEHAGQGQRHRPRPHPPSSHPAGVRGTGPASQAPPGQSARPSPSASPHPSGSSRGPAPPDDMSIAAAHNQIAAGGTAILVGSVSQDGHPVSGVTVRLLERLPGLVGWRQAGTARTSASGQATVRISDLRTNAAFRFSGPAGVTSRAVIVTVVPAVTLEPLSQPGAHRRTALIVKSPFARPGDVVVLQAQSSATWLNLKSGRLGIRGQRIFLISGRLASGRTFRVVLLPTRYHAGSTSTSLTMP